MDAKFNLIYFPVKAIGEPIRMLFKYGGIEFEDTRVDQETWKSMKDSTPFGQVPVLEIGERKGYQSVAICRYVANLVKLAGNTPLENLEIDAIVDTISEFRSRVSSYNREDNNSTQKISLKEELLETTIPFYLTKFNEIAKSGFMALGRLTWADLYFVAIMDYCNGVLKMDITQNYEQLKNLKENIYHIPSIKEWIDKRPNSDY